MDFRGKVAVVTGAGSGMGRSLSLALVKRGARVAGVDLHEGTLDETRALAGADFSSFPLDVSDAEAVKALPGQVKERLGSADVLINCAGIIQPFVRVQDLEDRTIERVMEVNFYGPLSMIRAFLPDLQASPEALLANVSSMGGFLPVPGQAIYGASKAALKLLTEALMAELAETNIRVCVIYPGAVATNIAQNSEVSLEGMDVEGSVALSAEDAAKIMVAGFEKNKPRILVGKDASTMDKMYRIAPLKAMRLIAKKMAGLLPDAPRSK